LIPALAQGCRPTYVRPRETRISGPGDVFATLALLADEHETLLRSLRAVSVERWLAAMPPAVVQPDAESDVIARTYYEHGVVVGVQTPGTPPRRAFSAVSSAAD
jgi:hypothetical protein